MAPKTSFCLPAAALDELCINTLRFLSVDTVQNANSGHPGMPLAAAPMAYVLWIPLMAGIPNVWRKAMACRRSRRRCMPPLPRRVVRP